MKKKNSKYWAKTFLITLSVALIILGLRYGLYFGFDIKLEQMFGGVGQSVIPPTCSVITTGSDVNSFQCPNDATSCEATIKLYCNKKTSEQLVIFRGSEQSHLPQYISIDSNDDGALESYVRSSVTTSSCRGNKDIVYLPEPFQQQLVFMYNNAIYICYGGKGYKYTPSAGGVSTANTLLPGESCDFSSGFVRCLGSSQIYKCSQDVTGSITKTITYGGTSPGTYTETLTLNKGNIIHWDGEIEYKIKKSKPSECTKNVEVPGTVNKYYECVIGLDGCGVISPIEKTCTYMFDKVKGECVEATNCITSDGRILNKGASICIDRYTLEKCNTATPPVLSRQVVTEEGKLCENGIIKSAYNVGITINGKSAASIVTQSGQTLNINVDITNTNNNKKIPVTASISGTSVSQTRYTGESGLNIGKVSLDLTSPNEGFYTLEILINHPDWRQTLVYDLRVTSELALSLYADNPIQYDSNYIELRLDAIKSGEQKRLSDYQYEAYFNGQIVTAYAIEPVGKNLKFLFNVSGDGVLRMRAKGTDETGYTTDWTQFKEVQVKETIVNINTEFVTGVCPGTYENRFTTTDSNGKLIDTSNIIVINEPLGGKTNTISPTKISTGTYKFSYNYVEGGLYVIKITSTTPYGVYELGQGLGVPVNILANCGSSGGIDAGGSPGINWTMYLVFGVIGGIIIFMIIVLRKRKNNTGKRRR